MNRSAFDNIRTSEEGKQLAATFAGVVITQSNRLPVPSRSAFTDALADEFGVTIHIVSGSFREMKPNGTVQTVVPWEATAVIGTTTENVGRLVYGTLAEETNPVNDVDYQKIGSHTLISKFSKTDPLVEFTAGQALCLPVIDNVSSIYKLSTEAAASGGGE
jgi:hypothetical protein